MKIKISWPTGIVIAIISFMVFILSFVYKVTFIDKYDHHLVSEDYYNDELNYQQEIDKLNNAGSLTENVKIITVKDGIRIVFPKQFEPSKISGTIVFKRASTDKIDFQIPIKLREHSIFIKDENLVRGLWNVKIDWEYQNEKYLLKQKIDY
jgi:nitrogen fixation protein FixH